MRLSLILTAMVVLAAMVMPAAADEVDDLIQDLKDDQDRVVRLNAIWALGWIDDPRVVDPLIEALKDEDIQVQIESATALGNIGDARAVNPLVEALDSEYTGVQQKAAVALGKIGDKQAVDPLIEALKDEHERTRYWAARALGEIGDPRAIDPLIEALNNQSDDEAGVRWAAADSLGKILGALGCRWNSFTPDQDASAAQPGGVFPLRDNDFEAGRYLVLMGPSGEDGLDLPPASWYTFGPYELRGGHKYSASILSRTGHLRFKEDPADLSSYSDPSPGHASVYARNKIPGDIWYAVCLQKLDQGSEEGSNSDDEAELDFMLQKGVAEGCSWDSFTPDQTAFVGTQMGVFPLRNSPFEAGNYLVLVGPAGENGLDLPPASWKTFGPYELKSGKKYKATIESPRGESLLFEEDPYDLLSYGDPSPGYANVYARNGCTGDIWYAICLQPINPIADTSMMSDEGSGMLSGDAIISLGDTTEVDEITPEMIYT